MIETHDATADVVLLVTRGGEVDLTGWDYAVGDLEKRSFRDPAVLWDSFFRKGPRIQPLHSLMGELSNLAAANDMFAPLWAQVLHGIATSMEAALLLAMDAGIPSTSPMTLNFGMGADTLKSWNPREIDHALARYIDSCKNTFRCGALHAFVAVDGHDVHGKKLLNGVVGLPTNIVGILAPQAIYIYIKPTGFKTRGVLQPFT